MKIVFCCVLTVIAISIVPAFTENVLPTEFLLKYGYLNDKGGNIADNPTPEDMQEAILKFQSFNGLPQTGTMDEETTQKMIAPRCGVKDINDGELDEYTAVSKWPKNLITWRIKKYSKSSRLSPDEQKRAIRSGLERWSNNSPLVFQETEKEPTIDISFERRHHGDNSAFDGRGRVLAHAYFPQNGDTHFDDDEVWINGKQGGTDLETVAAHEFGHALGLGHSNRRSSLMAPYYQTFPDNFKLHSDDIAGIQRLYGKKNTRVTTTTTTPKSTTTTTRRPTVPERGNGFCNHSYRHIDAAMRISGNDFVFVDSTNVIDGRSGQKMNIKNLFPGGPNLVQAAVYSKQTRKAYLFKDDRVWAYSLDSNGRFVLARNFPKLISNAYSHRPESVMQFNYGGSERIFLIKNGFFMEFIPYYETVSPGRGYQTRRFFANVPSRIDATISSDNEIFFIVKKKAYKMPNRTRQVDIRGKPVNLVFNKCRN